jgi:DNA-binding NarL/FixJ family response regulator
LQVKDVDRRTGRRCTVAGRLTRPLMGVDALVQAVQTYGTSAQERARKVPAGLWRRNGTAPVDVDQRLAGLLTSQEMNVLRHVVAGGGGET